MKFMLMMNGSMEGIKTEGILSWPPDDIKAHIAFMIKLNKELREEGVFVSAEGLAMANEARVVRAQKGSTLPAVTDGPFPETKEFLAGFWFVDVATPDEAYKIAARASAAPGRGGVPLNMPIEVRQVMSGPPPEFLP